jgi:hypothetical protein
LAKSNTKENRKNNKLYEWKWKMKLTKGKQCNQITKNSNKKSECTKNTKPNKFLNCRCESKISSQVLTELKSQSTTQEEAKTLLEQWVLKITEDIATILQTLKKNEN